MNKHRRATISEPDYRREHLQLLDTLIEEQKRTNELLKYLADTAYAQSQQ